jgi:hypothetical protein
MSKIPDPEPRFQPKTSEEIEIWTALKII